MLRKIDGKCVGPFPTFAEYYQGKSILAKCILPLTKWLRAIHVERFMEPRTNHLDIGCGDGYFLKRSRCTNCWGMDLRYGERFDAHLAFEDNFFDYVTMLAVIEHLDNPEAAVKEIHRVLKPGGKFIFTTPKSAAEKLIRFYAREVSEEHQTYFCLEDVNRLAEGLFALEAHAEFCLGLNQVFCLKKLTD